MTLNLNIAVKENVLVLMPSGDLLEAVGGEILFDEIKNYPTIRNVLINCSEIRHMNSTGISYLLKLLTTMRNKGGEVKLCSLPDNIQKLLIITKLSSIFSILDNEEQGIESFKK